MKTKEQELADVKAYAAKTFGINPDHVVGYNFGSCYDRIQVTTKEAADAVTEAVKDQTANGGMYHGMPLGGQSLVKSTMNNGEPYYDVYC